MKNWLLKNIFIFSLLAFFLNAIVAVATTKSNTIDVKSKSKKEILSLSGLLEGEYKLNKGPAACATGEIEVVGEEGDLSLKVGPHIMIECLDKTEVEEKEKDCTYTMQASVRKGELTGSKRELCKGQEPVTYGTTVKINGGKVTLIKKNTSEKSREYTCEYELLKD